MSERFELAGKVARDRQLLDRRALLRGMATVGHGYVLAFSWGWTSWIHTCSGASR